MIVINILFFSSIYHPDIRGGAEISGRILVSGMSESCDCMVLTIGREDCIEVIDGVPVRRVYVPWISEALFPQPLTTPSRRVFYSRLGFLLPRTSKILKRKFNDILDTFKPDIIHFLNNLYPTPYHSMYLMAKERGIPVIQTIRDLRLLGRGDVSGNKRFLWGFYAKQASQLVDYYHFPTRTLMDRYGKDLPPTCQQIHIPNTCGELFEKNSWRRLLEGKKNNQGLMIVYCGQLMEHKGVLDLAKIYPLIRHALGNNPYLTFIGDGNCRPEIEKILAKFLDNGEVEITGWIEHSSALSMMEKADFVILPSKWPEIFGRCLVEGFYRGALPIGSNMGGIPEVIGDRDLVFDSFDELPQVFSRFKSKEDRIKKLHALIPHMLQYEVRRHLSQFGEFYAKVKKC